MENKIHAHICKIKKYIIIKIKYKQYKGNKVLSHTKLCTC